MYGICRDQGRRDVVMSIMIIILWVKGKGEGRALPSEDYDGVEETTGTEQRRRQYEQVGGLPRWMYRVPDDAWWRMLQVMGAW